MHHTENDLKQDEARAAAHKRPAEAAPPEPINRFLGLSAETLRSELKYFKRKRKFIAAGNYLPMTTHNYTLAANQSYRTVDFVDRVNNKMRLGCRHWHEIPKQPPRERELLFCDVCADLRYRQIMLAEIDLDLKRIRTALRPLSPWWMRILTLIVVCTLAAGFALQGYASWRDAQHVVGAFDPRADENSDGGCP